MCRVYYILKQITTKCDVPKCTVELCMYIKICIEKHEASASSSSQVLLKIPKFIDILVPQGKFSIAFYKMFERNYTLQLTTQSFT